MTFSEISALVGIPAWLLIVVIIWSGVWKLAALWKSARKGSLVWFIVLALVNTVGILEILYIYVFSEAGRRQRVQPTRKLTRRKRRR